MKIKGLPVRLLSNRYLLGRDEYIKEITIIKGYNDNEASIKKIKNIIKEISPNKIIIARIENIGKIIIEQLSLFNIPQIGQKIEYISYGKKVKI